MVQVQLSKCAGIFSSNKELTGRATWKLRRARKEQGSTKIALISDSYSALQMY